MNWTIKNITTNTLKLIVISVFVLAESSAVFASSRVVTVGQDGNSDFTDPIKAVNSITDASKRKRYVVSIGPGVYFLSGRTLYLRNPYISIRGAGKDSTILQSASKGMTESDCCIPSPTTPSSDSAVIAFDNNGMSEFGRERTQLSDLTVRNFSDDVSDGVARAGIWALRSKLKMENVRVWVRAKSGSVTGIFCNCSSEINNVSVEIETPNQGVPSIALDVRYGDVDVHNSDMRIFGGIADESDRRAVYMLESFADFSASNLHGPDYGVDFVYSDFNLASSSVISWKTAVTDSSSSANSGDSKNSSPKASIRSSIISGTTAVDFGDNPDIKLVNNEIKGQLINDPEGSQCLNNYRPDLSPADC